MERAKSLALPMWNNERRNLLQRQSAKMAMDGAVAAKDERRVRLVGGIEFVAGEQVHTRQLKSPDVLLFGDRSEKGNGAHGATFAQRCGKNKALCRQCLFSVFGLLFFLTPAILRSRILGAQFSCVAARSKRLDFPSARWAPCWNPDIT